MQKESPSGGERKKGAWVTDAVKPANSGLTDAGFTRFVQKFNSNGVTSSPTTSSGDCRQTEQKVKIPKGIAGHIKP